METAQGSFFCDTAKHIFLRMTSLRTPFYWKQTANLANFFFYTYSLFPIAQKLDGNLVYEIKTMLLCSYAAYVMVSN